MTSARCFQCGFVGWSDMEFCKRCAAPMTQKLKSGLAIASLVIGILGFFTFGILGIGTVLGTVLGFMAISKVNRSPNRYGGKGMAIAGVVLSLSSILVAVPIGIIAAIAVPNLLAARRAANEGSTISALRTIALAEEAYYNKYEKYGTLQELENDALISEKLASGNMSGYRFSVELVERDDYPSGYEAVGVPLTYPNSGRRSFYVDETGVVRAADNFGGAASRFDTPIDSDNFYEERRRPTVIYEPDATKSRSAAFAQ